MLSLEIKPPGPLDRCGKLVGASVMMVFVSLVILLVVAILVILFLNRYYRKATREISLVRTGAGGQLVVLDGGCIALPFLHKVSESLIQN